MLLWQKLKGFNRRRLHNKGQKRALSLLFKNNTALTILNLNFILYLYVIVLMNIFMIYSPSLALLFSHLHLHTCISKQMTSPQKPGYVSRYELPPARFFSHTHKPNVYSLVVARYPSPPSSAKKFRFNPLRRQK